jgi:hypothetical protein
MTDRELIRALGGPKRVAAALGLSRQSVTNWTLETRSGIPPAHRPGVLALARSRGVVLDEDAFLRVPTLPALAMAS